MVSREYDGLAGAGGVKDACCQLGEALASNGYAVSTVMPRYGFMDPVELGFSPLLLSGTRPGEICGYWFESCFDVDMNYPHAERREQVAIWHQVVNGVSLYLVEAWCYGEKQGVYTYTEEEEKKESWQHSGAGHFDYFAMNVLLQKVALELMIFQGEQPWVIHCQDGHAAILPAIMRETSGYRNYFRNSGAVVTIHNAGLGYHQEVADLEFARAITGLPEHVIHGATLDDKFDPFLVAAKYAVLNTVSENYARELQETTEDFRTGWLGHTLVERGLFLRGVTNGIDPDAFNPEEPEKLGLAAPFSIVHGDLAGKDECKKDLLANTHYLRQWERVEQFGTLTNDAEKPLFTFIGRLTEQKGMSVVLGCMESFFMQQDVQLLILGSGDAHMEGKIQQLCDHSAVRGRCCFLKGFDSKLANKAYAGGDFFLIPSWYEPCGLTDYMAQLLGNLPIVHHVGGLVKVLDEETGFAYTRNTPAELTSAMNRALTVFYNKPELHRMQQNAVETILARHTWQHVMHAYIELYQEAHKRTLTAG
ncbi:MAG: glycogen synthase [Desulfobulbus propionicus]|nr:MAG: glycogen synthase [Desulfobulbus propionicus]PIE64010.1 MAG: glycogen synthase [Desulfobacterales bacterium]